MSEQPSDRSDSGFGAYLLAITCCLFFLLLKLGLRRYVGDTVPFVLFFSAVMISAWFGGLGPGLLATAMCTLFAALYFFDQNLSFWSKLWPLVTFGAEGVSISVLSQSRRRILRERTALLQRERAAREEAEQIGQKLKLALASTTSEMAQRMRSEEQLRQIAAEREGVLASERAARSEAERAGRMKDEFLATLSHELRTPLNAILGWSQILAGEGRNEADLAEGLAAIERNARSQTQIIADLLDMSRIISGKVRFDVQRVDLASTVRAAIATVKPAADAKGVRVYAALDPTAGPVSGDPNRLQQVFWNLLNNAVKFTSRGGRVQVLLGRVDSHVELSVADTGEGIGPEFLPYVFDRFRQSDASTTRQHGGLGLGLAIVKQLVELHGGRVTARSPGKGHGTTFTVSLPMTAIDQEPAPPQEQVLPQAGAIPIVLPKCADITGIKVLVVDDEPDARAMVKRLLEECKATVITAASAVEAVERVKSERPDVIVSDIGMPTEDGYSLIRQVRALAPEQGGETPAVALTAYARAEDRVKAVVAGFQHHVSKPIEPAELIAMVANLAGRNREPPKP